MKNFTLLFLGLFMMSATQSQVVINEILPNGTIELKNIGSTTENAGTLWLCNWPSYAMISNLNLDCGNTSLAPGDILVVDNFSSVASDNGELGLYTTNTFTSSAAMIDYVEWGATGHVRSSVAVEAGIWTTGDFVPGFTNGNSLEWNGAGNGSENWGSTAEPTICSENSNVGGCGAIGGEISGEDFIFCIDETADFVSGVEVSGNDGDSSAWVVTDLDLNILGLPDSPEDVDFNAAGSGVCLIWHMSYSSGLSGLEVDSNVEDLEGCYDLSNSVTVTREEPMGGELIGGPYEFCVDGESDFVTDLVLEGAEGVNVGWVITEEDLTIIGLPDTIALVDFDAAGVGVCLIWSISYSDGIVGLEMDANADDLEGCFALSNSVMVTRGVGAPFCSTGVSEEIGNRELLIFPNPATDQITIQMGSLTSPVAILEVYTIEGRLISTQQVFKDAGNLNMDIANLSNGYYVMKIQDGQNINTANFTVVR